MSNTSTPTFAVVGRVNKGKSSVVSTLIEDDSVRVDKAPGTTRVCTRFPFRADDGRVVCTVIDTPGFEEGPRALTWLRKQEGSAADRPAIVARFVETFRGSGEFADECALLEPIVAGAAVLYVVDASLPYRANYEAEMEILRWTGRPCMALINRIGGDDHIGEWRRALEQYFNVVRVFDAHRSGFDERMGLLQAFREIDDKARAGIDETIAVLRADWKQRQERTSTILAQMIVEAVTHTEEHTLGEHEDAEGNNARWGREFLEALRKLERRERRAVELLYRHERLERDEAVLARERFEWDLFAQESRRVFGLDTWQLVRAGTVGGAAIGGTLDAAALGGSFLVGTIAGGVVGGLSTYLGTLRAARIKIFGQGIAGRVVRIGPLSDPNFPWILLDRGILHFGSVARRAHAKRDVMRVDDATGKTGVSSGLDATARNWMAGLFSKIRRQGAPVSHDLVDELARSLAPLVERAAAGSG